jgi:hypothetical protein
LSIDEVSHTVALGSHDRTEEIGPVGRHTAPLMLLVEHILETCSQVVDELADLCLLPAVLTLVEVEPISVVRQQLRD